MDIDFAWTPAGRAEAALHGIELAAVVAVVYNPTVQVWVGEGERRLMLLGGNAGLVMVVTLDRPYRTIDYYEITGVRPATVGEYRAWEKRQP